MKKFYASLLTLAMGAFMAANAADIPANATCYDGSEAGSLIVNMFNADILNGAGTGIVYIIPVSDGVVNFLLPNLILPGMGEDGADGELGDIQLDNVTATTQDDGSIIYNGVNEDYSLMDGEIHAKVSLANDGEKSSYTKDGKAHFDIDVIWYTDYPDNLDDTLPIYVTFNGVLVDSAIADTTADADATVRYYDLQGNSVNADALNAGQVYIQIANGKATKVIK